MREAKANQKKASAAYNSATASGAVHDKEAADRLAKATQGTQWAKRQLRSEKAKERLNRETGGKSKHRQKLEAEYKKKGMSDEEAEIAAYKRARTEKIIAATAGVTIAAAAAYIAYRHYDKSVDKFIKAGTELQNISNNSNRGISDAFYFSMTKSDNLKYRGMYGQNIRDRGQTVYETKIGVKKALKVASEKSAVKALSDLVSGDADYAKTLLSHLESSVGRYDTGQQEKVIRDGLNSLRKGRVDTKVYNALNMSLVDHELPTSSRVNTGFYDKLKSLGYDVIADVTDKKYSGFKSSKPMIAFNAASKAAVNSVRKVGLDEMDEAARKAMNDIKVKSAMPSAAEIAAVAGFTGLGYAGLRSSQNRRNDAIVREYKKKHPNTELSYDQILNNYYRK